MNNRFLGNAPSLLKYDLLIQTANAFSLPVWYISMLTEPLPRNKGDKNATNYRIGSQNTALLELMKEQFFGDESTIIETCDLMKRQKVSLKTITTRNNQKADHYRIGYLTHFNHKERAAYFEGVISLLDKNINQLIFADPDTGVMPSTQKLNAAKGNSFISTAELKSILDTASRESIIIVNQQLTNYQYSHDARMKDVYKDLQTDIILLVDEVIQTGVYFITKSPACHDLLCSHLWDYLSPYRFVKSTERVMLLTVNAEGVIQKSLGALEISSQ